MNEHESGQVAASAAEVYETFFVPALFIDWPPHLLGTANVSRGDVVLDVACGTGVLAHAAADIVGTEGKVTGVDINDGMLAVAYAKAPHITWENGPVEDLPFDDNSFDRVVSQFGLMFFQDRVKALTEMRRVLHPEGLMAVAVWDSLQHTPGYAAVAQILADLFGPEVAQSIEAPYALGDKTQLANLFTAAGMPDVTIQTVHGQARFNSIEEWIYTDIKGWTLAGVIDEDGYQQLKQHAPQKLAQVVVS